MTSNLLIVQKAEWDSAKEYFRLNPGQVKYKKADKAHYSFLKVNGEIYAMAHAHLGTGGFSIAKIGQKENGENVTIKIEGKRDALREAQEDQVAHALGELKGRVQRHLPNMRNFWKKYPLTPALNVTDKYYKVMEYHHGENLNAIAYRLNQTQKIIVAIQIAKALKAMHAQRIIHSDLKGGNVIVSVDAANPQKIEAAIIDFNISKILPLHQNDIANGAGTPVYMAPEHSNLFNGRVSFKTDIYELGKTFEKDLQLPNEFYSNLTKADPSQRPNLDVVITQLTKALELRPDLNAEGRKLLPAPAPVPAPAPIYVPFVPVPAEKLDLVPRTRLADDYHHIVGPLDFQSKKWQQINSTIDLVNNPNSLWVSLGTGSAREKLFFDSNSAIIQGLKAQALRECQGKSINGALTIVNRIVDDLTKQDGVDRRVVEAGLDAKLDEFLLRKRMLIGASPEVTMDELIKEKVLVCRHKGLLAASIIAHLVEQGVLPQGKVRQFRSSLVNGDYNRGAHNWAVYREDRTNELWVADPRWLVVGEATKNMAYLERQGYGDKTLKEMMIRLDREDGKAVENGAINRFIAAINVHLKDLPLSKDAYLNQGTPSVPGMQIRLELNVDKNASSALALQAALRAQNIQFDIRNHGNDFITIPLAANNSLLTADVDKIAQDVRNAGLADARRKAEEARQLEALRLAEEARKAEEVRRQLEALRLAEENARKAEVARKREEEARRLEEQRRQEEAARLEAQRKRAEQEAARKRLEQEAAQKRAQEERIKEEARQRQVEENARRAKEALEREMAKQREAREEALREEARLRAQKENEDRERRARELERVAREQQARREREEQARLEREEQARREREEQARREREEQARREREEQARREREERARQEAQARRLVNVLVNQVGPQILHGAPLPVVQAQAPVVVPAPVLFAAPQPVLVAATATTPQQAQQKAVNNFKRMNR